MKVSTVTAATLLGGAFAAPLEQRSTNQNLQSDALTAQGLQNLAKYTAAHGYPSAKSCTLNNVTVRKEWSALTATEQKAYIAAVQCLASKPAKTPSSIAAGAKNRYDDFVATHINQTLTIHGTGNFLTWHRYFTWAYEQALRNECGYTGYQPYYNWPKWAANPLASPTFDGSATSMSGNGAYVKHNATCIPASTLCEISLPAGTGGGCVASGPFKNWQVHLGPVSGIYTEVTSNPSPDGLGYNPRCLRRDISTAASQGWTKDSDVVALIQNNTDFYDFSTNMQGNFPAGYLGVHTAGHFTVGGDPGGDLFTSPGDPYFFLHHAMIDRTYWTWQNQDIANRQNAIGATITLNNSPPSRNATLSDPIALGFVGVPDTTIGALTNTIAGPLCYIYQ